MASCAEIAGQLQAYLDEDTTPAEKVIFERHLASCASCAQLFEDHRAMSAFLYETLREARLDHDLTGDILAHLPEMDAVSRYRRTRKALSQSQSQSHSRSHDTHIARRRKHWWMPWVPSVAAAIIAVLGLALVLSWPESQQNDKPDIGLVTCLIGEAFKCDAQADAFVETAVKARIKEGDSFETGDNGALMIGLAGPSHVKVDANSHLRVLGERRISLDNGRVWLDVCKSARLFRVSTPVGDVTVFGTRFSVSMQGESAWVAVQEGEVQVENDVTFVRLNPGERVEVVLHRKPLVKESMDMETEFAWTRPIQPAPEALSLLLTSIPPRQTSILHAKQVFIVPTQKSAVASINFEWERPNVEGARASYHIYVSGDQLQSLFKGYVDADLLNSEYNGRYELPVPDDVDLSGISVLHIDVVSDNSTGDVDTPFTDVYAVGM